MLQNATPMLTHPRENRVAAISGVAISFAGGCADEGDVAVMERDLGEEGVAAERFHEANEGLRVVARICEFTSTNESL